MLKFFKWIRKYWYLPLLLIASGVGFCFGRRIRGNPLLEAKTEIQAIKAAAETEKLRARVGADRARQIVEAAYHENLQELEDKKRKKAEELRNDPAKLAKFLVRAGNSVKRR